jgi:hypothetical protein
MHMFSRTFFEHVAQLTSVQNSRREEHISRREEHISVQIMMNEDSRLVDRLGGKNLDINLLTVLCILHKHLHMRLVSYQGYH